MTYKVYDAGGPSTLLNTFNGATVSEFELCTEAQARAFVAVAIAPNYPYKEIQIGKDPGPGTGYKKQDPKDDRDMWEFFTDDGSVQAQQIGHMISETFSKGIGYPVEWKWVARKSVSVKGEKALPPKLQCVFDSTPSIMPHTPVPAVQLPGVKVSASQASLIAGD